MFQRAGQGSHPSTPSPHPSLQPGPEDGHAVVTLHLDGVAVTARASDSVAAALLLAGQRDCRLAPVSGQPRGPYCLMGVCFECMVTIDNIANRQACMELVREGMAVTTRHGVRSAGAAPLEAGA